MDQAIIDTVRARVGTALREKWVLGRVIGAGSSAAVYEGTHRTNGKKVAVKVMHAFLVTSEDVVARFRREGYIANRVGHPGAVTILDDDTTDDGTPFLVMDRLEGESLASVLERPHDAPSLSRSLRIAHDVLDILAAAHAHGITHRDIKPGNVFLTTTGQVMLLDFGIARLREEMDSPLPGGADLTQRVSVRMGDESALGTPRYMPPEQALRHWNEVDAQSDLWSVGAMMFRLLTGKPVRAQEDASELLLAAMTERAPSVSSFTTMVPEDVASIVDKALELEKSERWADARAMQSAIRAALKRLGASRANIVVPPRDSSIRVSVLPAPRRAGGRVAFAAFLAFVVIAVMVAFKPLDAHLRVPAREQVTAAPPPPASAVVTLTSASHEVVLPSATTESEAPAPQLRLVPTAHERRARATSETDTQPSGAGTASLLERRH